MKNVRLEEFKSVYEADRFLRENNVEFVSITCSMGQSLGMKDLIILAYRNVGEA